MPKFYIPPSQNTGDSLPAKGCTNTYKKKMAFKKLERREDDTPLWVSTAHTIQRNTEENNNE